MTSIPVFQLALKLSPDDEVDILPRRFDGLDVFVPGCREDIALAMASINQQPRQVEEEYDTPSLSTNKRKRRRSSKVEERGATPGRPDQAGHMSTKTEQSLETGGRDGVIELECVLIPSDSGAAQLLGLGEDRIGLVHHTLAVVAHLPLPATNSKAGLGNSNQRKKKEEGEKADPPQEGYSSVVLGHIVPGCFRTDHPMKQLDPTLLSSGWLRFDRCVVSLQSPFIPEAITPGAHHPHPAGRAVKTYVEDKGWVWQDPQTKLTWTTCPHRDAPVERLFGSMSLVCSMTEKALKYGESPDDDGFVDSTRVPRRDLILSSKLRKVLTESLSHRDGLIRPGKDDDEYWSRKRERFYDVPQAERGGTVLPLDARLETALEATRPKIDSSMKEPPKSIKTSLMPFQKKALAWMYEMEVDTTQDEGALLPQWDKIECVRDSNGLEEPRAKKLKQEHGGAAGSSPRCFYMDQTSGVISLTRMTSRRSEAGGCLCDAMGLGKSLTTLSLIETHQRPPSYVDPSRSALLAAGLDRHVRPYASTATLLVVPSSLVHQWYSEVSKHLGRDVDEAEGNEYIQRFTRGVTLPWGGDSDRQEVRKQAQSLFAGGQQAPRIVLATYEDLRIELLKSKKSKNAISPLLEIHWWRIMLDEAQLVSTSNGSAAEMVNCLWRVNGWIITSTPFNSSIRDMHGLLTFLDSDFASKKLFDELIATPFLEGKEEGIVRAHALLKRIMWRHRKEHVESELDLPPSTMDTLLLEARGLEKTLYEREFKSMLENVKTAVGLGRTLTKGQTNRLVALRKMISHPQLATQLGYKASGGQRTTFANLFADLIYRKQSEIQAAQWELIVCALKVGAGKRFHLEEKDRTMWLGGSCSISHFDNKIRKARELAAEGCEREDVQRKQIAARRDAVNQANSDAQSDANVKMEEGTEGEPIDAETTVGEDNPETQQPPSVENGCQAKEGKAMAGQEGTGVEVRSAVAASASMRYTEAMYWLDTLLAPRGRQEEVQVPREARIDPERLIHLFFERKVVDASSVDADDARYHPVLLDAGDEEEDVEEGDQGKDQPDKAVLLKNRFRGNEKRSVRKVWYYHPRRKLQALCREFTAIEERIDQLQREGAFLHNRLEEELGPERARLALLEGFDTLQQQPNSEGDNEEGATTTPGQTCIICMDTIDVPGVLPCLHTACFVCLKDCISKMADSTGKALCSMCRKPYSRQDIIEVLPAMTEMEQVDEFGVKISGLITHIRSQMEVNPDVKIVIFSAWSSYLAMLTKALNELGEGQNESDDLEPIKSIAFSGKEQSKALSKFQKDDSIRIILVPMRMAEGAAGLTLNIASVAYLLEPCLDSTLEDQALGRLNRIGQKADKTTYYRVLVKNTIEPALVDVAERRQEAQRQEEEEEGEEDDRYGDKEGGEEGPNARRKKKKQKGKSKSKKMKKSSQNSNFTNRHHDHLTVEELAHVFGLDLKREKDKKRRNKKEKEKAEVEGDRAEEGSQGQGSSSNGQEEEEQ